MDTEVAKPEFKILSSGTHSEMAPNGVTWDAPPEPAAANAEPAKQAAPASSDAPAATKSTETGNAEPAKPTPSAKLGSSNPQDAPATTATEDKPAPLPPQKWDEVLKAQGFDEKFIDLAKFYQKEGKLDKYLEATTTDYGKMSNEQIHRINLQRENPKATPEQLESLYEIDVVEKYKLDPDTYTPDGKEAKAAKVKMELDADKLRNRFTEDGKQFTLPSRDVVADQAQQAEQARQSRDKDIEDFMGQPYSKSVMTDKKLTLSGLGAGIPDFHIEIEKPETLKDILFNPGVYGQYTRDKDGNPDAQAQLQIAAFAHNRIGFIQALIGYGKSLGKEEYVEEKFNPPGAKGTAAAPATKTIKEAFGAAASKNGRNG